MLPLDESSLDGLAADHFVHIGIRSPQRPHVHLNFEVEDRRLPQVVRCRVAVHLQRTIEILRHHAVGHFFLAHFLDHRPILCGEERVLS